MPWLPGGSKVYHSSWQRSPELGTPLSRIRFTAAFKHSQYLGIGYFGKATKARHLSIYLRTRTQHLPLYQGTRWEWMVSKQSSRPASSILRRLNIALVLVLVLVLLLLLVLTWLLTGCPGDTQVYVR